ncbi:hypothetical protein J6590_058634 [Homalodisca vitripennis]|uniref:Uncharacterized protein n=1 Tax=Homalodisca liturata TaxID=320908 RepID=A0A1B6HKQ2_9HEMI|nr:hypothetical protein J6590_094001 [Homalodisca vitripennis]KAG8335852.1 hypothetical protein J6590_058634 [Homalodisca vitripennis]
MLDCLCVLNSYRHFTVVCFIFLVTHFCQCLLDIKDTKTVLEFGQNLAKRLTDSPSGTKEDIINDLTDYFICLNTAFRVKNENKEMLQELKVQGGPPFLGLVIHDDLLVNKYDMEPVEVDHTREVLEDIQRIWKDISNEIMVSPELEVTDKSVS